MSMGTDRQLGTDRSLNRRSGMTAAGHSRRLSDVVGMSASPPTPDVSRGAANRRFGPAADNRMAAVLRVGACWIEASRYPLGGDAGGAVTSFAFTNMSHRTLRALRASGTASSARTAPGCICHGADANRSIKKSRKTRTFGSRWRPAK